MDCPICIELMQTPVTLACGHSTCKHCLTKWVETKPECPICRAEATPESVARLSVNISLQSIIAPSLAEQRRVAAAKTQEERKQRALENERRAQAARAQKRDYAEKQNKAREQEVQKRADNKEAELRQRAIRTQKGAEKAAARAAAKVAASAAVTERARRVGQGAAGRRQRAQQPVQPWRSHFRRESADPFCIIAEIGLMMLVLMIIWILMYENILKYHYDEYVDKMYAKVYAKERARNIDIEDDIDIVLNMNNIVTPTETLAEATERFAREGRRPAAWQTDDTKPVAATAGTTAVNLPECAKPTPGRPLSSSAGLASQCHKLGCSMALRSRCGWIHMWAVIMGMWSG